MLITSNANIQFWNTITTANVPDPERGCYPVGTKVESIHNPNTYFLTPASWQSAQQDASHVPDTIREPIISKVTFPIDVVYTWVDNSDQYWSDRRNAAMRAEYGAIDDTGTANRRFASHDELRYSLRSLEFYAGWVNHVYIVTDGQVPSWLNTDNDRVSVVDHQDIFTDRSVLPVFNSHAIESQLHHIDGLSEHYLYMNDDVFLGQEVWPETFFEANGLARFFASVVATIDFNEVLEGNYPLAAAAKSARKLLQDAFGVTIIDRFQHTPHPQRRSTLFDMESRWPDLFQKTASHRFRGKDDISFAAYLHHWYGYCIGESIPGSVRYSYVKIADANAARIYRRLQCERNRDVFCLNESDALNDMTRRNQQALTSFLETYYPIASSFEK